MHARFRMSIPDEYKYKLNTNTGGGGPAVMHKLPEACRRYGKGGGFTKQKVHENIAFLLTR